MKSYVHSKKVDRNFPYFYLDEKSKDRPQLMHNHTQIQLTQIISGELELKTLGKTCTAKEGEVVFVNKEVYHQIIPKENCIYRSFFFSDTLLFGGNSKLYREYISVYSGDRTIPIFLCQNKDIFEKLNSLHSTSNPILIVSKLLEIWYELFDMKEKPYVKQNQTMEKLLYFIHQNYSKNLSLEEISDVIPVSISTLLRLFKRYLNTSPYQYIQNYRLQQSLDLLLHRDLTVAEVALRVGYINPSLFNKHFLNAFGRTPLKYRKYINETNT